MIYEYPHTDFNEYNLDWVIKRIKDLTTEWVTYKTELDADWLSVKNEWSDMKSDLEELKTFITSYFDNLDVQEEINNKIDEMVADGSLLNVIKSTVETQTASTTASWLTTHITQPEGVVIDTSLTVAGACADAKATGDAITDVNEALEPLFSDSFKIVQGIYAFSDGVPVDYSYWCRSSSFIPKHIVIRTNNEMRLMPQAYDENTDEYIGQWNGTEFNKTAYSGYGKMPIFDWDIWHEKFPSYKFKLNFSIGTNIDITPADVYNAITISETPTVNNFLTEKFLDESEDFINYSPDSAFIGSQYTYSYAEFFKNRFVVYANYTASYVVRLTTNPALELSSALASYDDGIEIKANRKYRLTTYVTAGSRQQNNEIMPIVTSVYPLGATSSIGSSELIGNNIHVREFSVDTDQKVNICIYLSANNIYNAEGYITLQDVTDDSFQTFYLPELQDTIGKVRNNADEPSLVFPIVTDIHRYTASVQNFSDMIANMKAFCKEIQSDFVLNTGDTIEGNQNKETSLGVAYDCISDFKNIGLPFMYSEGNHDNNPYISSGALVFNLKEIYSGFFLATKNVTFNVNENGTDFYYDFNNLGIRFISINSCNVMKANNYGYGDSTPTWLESALQTDHLVILATHVTPISTHVWNNINPANSDRIRNALNTFVSNGGELIMITGHSHVDGEWIDPYIEITNVCQKFEQADISTTQYQAMSGMIDGIRNPARVENEYSEDAWTIAICKPVSKEINFIRFGAGVDRYIHYEKINESTTVVSKLENVTWSTSNSSIASVTNGNITVLASGKCAIIAKDQNGNIEIWLIEN